MGLSLKYITAQKKEDGETSDADFALNVLLVL